MFCLRSVPERRFPTIDTAAIRYFRFTQCVSRLPREQGLSPTHDGNLLPHALHPHAPIIARRCTMINKLPVFFISLFLCLTAGSLMAQDAAPQFLSVHEDLVIPSKAEEYEQAALGLVNAIKKHNVSSISYTAASMDDFTYIYFSPVENLAGVDKINASFGELQEKMGKDAFSSTMKAFDACYPSHRNYLVRLRPDLSYKPEQGAQISEGLNFRHWDFYHIQPGMEDEAEAIAKAWVALNDKIKSTDGYRLYSNSYGLEGPVFIVVQSAKSAADFYKNSEAWMKKTGEEGRALMNRTWKVIRKFESKDGMIRPELSVSPQPITKAK